MKIKKLMTPASLMLTFLLSTAFMNPEKSEPVSVAEKGESFAEFLSHFEKTELPFVLDFVDFQERSDIFEKPKKKKEAKEKIDEAPVMRISVPQKNFEKFKEVLLYILNKVGSKANVGETVIYKLLYFIDFDYYEKYEEQFIGASYIKNKYGPTPVEFVKLVSKMIEEGEIEKVDSDYYSYPQTKYLPRRKPDLKKLSAIEKDVIDDVLNRLSDMNAAQISEYSHGDIPWLTTEDEDPIDYELVFYRNPPYNVREYEIED